MDAVEFLKAQKRMCETNDCNKGGCPLFQYNCHHDGTDEENVRTVVIVEKWAKEHPVKTRQSEFLKQWPDAEMFEARYLNICPALISKEYRSEETNECNQPEFSCGKCKREFWLKEIE